MCVCNLGDGCCAIFGGSHTRQCGATRHLLASCQEKEDDVMEGINQLLIFNYRCFSLYSQSIKDIVTNSRYKDKNYRE